MDPYDRLEHKGAIDPIMERVCDTYELGDYAGFEVIPVGYEDFNVRLRTDRSDYFVKVFASERTAEEIERFDTIMRAVMRSDVRYPRVVSLGDEVIHTDRQSQLQMVVMEYVEGQTFFDMKRLPTEEETDQILRQAALINQINLKPAPLFDSWAIPNIERQYGLVRQHLSVEERTEVEEIIDTYN